MKHVYLSIFLTFWSSIALFAQSSPIESELARTPQYVGVILGLGQNMQGGDAYVDCPSAKFTGGTKFGYSIGGFYEYSLSDFFLVGVSASYKYLGIDAVFTEIEPCELNFTVNNVNHKEIANISFENSLEVDLHNITIAPYIKYTPWKFMFLRAGFGIGTNFSTNIKHSKNPAQRTVKLSNGEVMALKVDGDPTLQDSEVLEAVSPQMYILPALGFNIPFSQKVDFLPVFEYGIPLTNVSDWGNNFQSSSWRINFELRIKIAGTDY